MSYSSDPWNDSMPYRRILTKADDFYLGGNIAIFKDLYSTSERTEQYAVHYISFCPIVLLTVGLLVDCQIDDCVRYWRTRTSIRRPPTGDSSSSCCTIVTNDGRSLGFCCQHCSIRLYLHITADTPSQLHRRSSPANIRLLNTFDHFTDSLFYSKLHESIWTLIDSKN